MKIQLFDNENKKLTNKNNGDLNCKFPLEGIEPAGNNFDSHKTFLDNFRKIFPSTDNDLTIFPFYG